MTCIKAQGLITAYINNELAIDELEEFIEHVQGCEECMEELEVYYALLTAMKQLDEDKNLSDDFSQELNEKIVRTQERIIHLKYNYYRKKGVLVMTILLISIFFSLYHYIMPREDENMVTKSRFRLRVSFMKERFDRPTEELERYLEEQLGNMGTDVIE